MINFRFYGSLTLFCLLFLGAGSLVFNPPQPKLMEFDPVTTALILAFVLDYSYLSYRLLKKPKPS